MLFSHYTLLLRVEESDPDLATPYIARSNSVCLTATCEAKAKRLSPRNLYTASSSKGLASARWTHHDSATLACVVAAPDASQQAKELWNAMQPPSTRNHATVPLPALADAAVPHLLSHTGAVPQLHPSLTSVSAPFYAARTRHRHIFSLLALSISTRSHTCI